MPVVYKDIDDLSQRSTPTGSEKFPVSDTEYLTAQQVADLAPVPTQLSQLSDDATHRTVTDTQIAAWNGKADKVTGATNGNFAGLDASGNLTDSGSKAGDFATAAQGGKADTAVQPGDLATVATTGDYGDLLNKPTIPAAQVNSDWDAVSGVAQILNKPSLATVATSGAYSDLDGTPTIPTITLNGTATSTPSFYAPTAAGTSGQVLTSSGSGAPTWQAQVVVEALTTAEIDTIWNAAMA